MNNSYVITTDAMSDLYFGYYDENPTDRLLVPFTINNTHYSGDDKELSMLDFYKILRQGHFIKSSLVNPYEAEQLFTTILESGKDVMHISFSSGMSGCYENLVPVVRDLQAKFPQRKVVLVDSLSGGGGSGLAVYYAKKMQKQGKSIEEVEEWLIANRTHIHQNFIVDDIKNIKNSGRISAFAAAIGSLLHLKPILEINKAGGVSLLAKAIGRKKAITTLVDCFKNYYEPDKNDFILIGHMDDDTEAKKLGSILSKIVPEPMKYCYINQLVSGHSGYNALVVYFLGKERKH